MKSSMIIFHCFTGYSFALHDCNWRKQTIDTLSNEFINVLERKRSITRAVELISPVLKSAECLEFVWSRGRGGEGREEGTVYNWKERVLFAAGCAALSSRHCAATN